MTTETRTPTESPPQQQPLSSSAEERLARIEAQQEIIIELLKGQDLKIDALDRKFDTKIDVLDMKFDAKLDALDKKFDTKIDALDKKFDVKLDDLDKKVDAKIDDLDKKVDAKIDTLGLRIDTINHRIFLAGLGLFTIVGAGVAAYIVNLLT